MTCVFCESPDIKPRTITENEFARVFPTNIPITAGHVLVIPKRCVAKYEELTSEEKISIEDLRERVAIALKKAFGVEGFNFAWNDGKVAGQSVPHFHLHVIPRKEGDSGIYGYDPRKFIYRPGSREESPEAELQAVAENVRNAIIS